MPHRDEQRKRKEELEILRAAAIAAEDKKVVAPAVDTPKPGKKEEPTKFVPVGIKPKGMKALLEAYKAYAEEHNLKIDRTGAMVFPTRDDAIKFFESRVKFGDEFFVKELRGNSPTGYYLISGGDHLYKGTLSEIQQELGEAVKRNPSDSRKVDMLEMVTKELEKQTLSADQAIRMREELQGHRSGEPEVKSPAPTCR